MPYKDPFVQRIAVNALGRENVAKHRDITALYPPPGDEARRSACERDLRLFCESYFPNAFNLAWSEDHLKAIGRMESVILDGGLYALAMPRGSGKTTLCERSALWALLYGHRLFVALIGATEKRAQALLKSIKTELGFNDRLASDFRHVCYPIRRLENNGRLAIGQLFDGKETRIEWSVERLTFPLMPDWACDGTNVSGSTVTVSGITGSIRGQSHTLADGTVIRPELVILDDPQTRESAMSASQSENRAAIVSGDVLGMGGPGRKVAAIMPCTVIRSGDMADTMLDRSKNPEWSGLKTKMVYSFPVNMDLWEEYKAIRADGLESGKGIGECNEFYREHRDSMDDGCVVGWPERFDPDSELSAVQHAMNLLFLSPSAFHAEYQNEPQPVGEAMADGLTPDRVASKFNRLARGSVSLACQKITAFIDVQATILYYAVCAWEDDFTGYVIDYGTYPDQNMSYFALADAKATLDKAHPGMGPEGRIYAGLEFLTSAMFSREWDREDGTSLKIDRCLIDANWGQMTQTVHQFCRQSAHATSISPSHGKYVGAGSMPMSEYGKKPGEKAGLNWRLISGKDKGSVRRVIFDTNYWKSFIRSRLSVAMGDRGCLSLFGSDPSTHRLFADHLCAEYPVRTQGRGREVDEWKWYPNRPDNHYLDCLVGCAVAASIQGVSLPESAMPKRAEPPKRVSFADLQRRKYQHQVRP